MKPTIDPRVRAKLEEIGVDAVKSKLLWIMNVRTLGQQDQREEDLGDGIRASRREIQEWLSAKTARERATWKVWIAPALTLIVIGIASTNFILTIRANRPELVSTQSRLFVVPAAKPPEWVELNWNNIGKRSAHRGTVTLFTVSNDGNRHEKFAQSEITANVGGGTTLHRPMAMEAPTYP